jgi:hypothetical protein
VVPVLAALRAHHAAHLLGPVLDVPVVHDAVDVAGDGDDRRCCWASWW